ncbi:DEAD/DEAH box helicase (plasmid) [Arthrobacter sp. NtRootA4]|uniref:DNA helicase-like protein n=1 Tax=Paenarthrobacter nicotinovorans TaxID=29320 RepID=Q8GAK3_PAENI|nr:DEAD/DEAH box helicase [Paenarthrobacter nicotinovorans]BCW12942.1 DEAD/DEAH box helicase [Arthrobacter sp. NtRootA2]BCW17173.1 DEAD/DEAH box helicase [Arthrobacter sp. NtRootA4]BCW25281.1 DEAD/DEAH box helicase [Arthrobacter sp. NtRootC7]BCW29643.1 DEAD/DEAH box helicase [Arthrobacter sp. NtRootC45]BCW33820.1 DEAD/DEAH box helicase [Arthrobacter sp. NtRootD5]
MTSRTAADLLSEMIVEREDFQSAYENLERAVAELFLSGEVLHAVDPLEAKHLLRYADVLSHASDPRHRELAYTTIALLREYDSSTGFDQELSNRLLAVAEAVLVQLGNFPGIATLQKGVGSRFALPLSRGTLRIAKEVLQRTSKGDATLTDTQYAITEKMRGEDYFSFSGPTSLGKSFIIKDALYDIVRRDDLNDHCVVVLVPTKALIGQTAADLRKLLADVPEVNVATYPSLPKLLRQKYRRTVFVLTPERLLRYLANPVREIDYLVVDEAQKVIAKNDARSSLYYHSIVEVTRRFATKLVFASPSIENPELFLELFGKAVNGAFTVRERTVAQQRYFVDLIAGKQYYFSGQDTQPREIEAGPGHGGVVDLILSLSGERKAIIYINGSLKSAEFALRLAERRNEVTDEKVEELAAHVREYVHKDYFLANTLRHGVAFHHGKMPQEVRERVEQAFADPDSAVQFVVCTSTLLEGVNLPAKNIFVLNDKHGNSLFTKIDFENLAGRAGRLTYDFSGNVVCVREEDNRWATTTRALISRSDPGRAESFLVRPANNRKKEYTDIARILRGESLPAATSADQQRSVEQYASILTLHQLDNQQTPLRSYFLDKVKDGRELLRKAASSIAVPTDVLRRSPNILPKYQDRIWNELKAGSTVPLVTNDAVLSDVQTFLTVLRRLSTLYDWRTTEVSGTDPLMPRRADADGWDRRLYYWALLMRGWVRGDPISRVISSSVAYYSQRGSITYRDYSREESLVTEPFDRHSAKHINLIIEWTLKDIEGGLRFRIMGYLQNFIDVSVMALGRNASGINVATLVEYGTTDERAIQLQEVGFGRAVAAELLADHADALRFSDENELEELDHESVLARTTLSDEARAEVENIMVKMEVEVDSAEG